MNLVVIDGDFVPYTGAANDVDLGVHALSAGNIVLSGGISLNGLYGDIGQVLTSKGVGDAEWKSPEDVASSYFCYTYDDTTQTVASNDIAAMEFNGTQVGNGVVVAVDGTGFLTKIIFDTAGTYNIQFSAQAQRTSGGADMTLTIWLRVDGVDVPNSATSITMKANTNYVVAAWNFFQTVTAGQYAQIMWSHNDAIELLYEAADPVLPHPAIPSVILTVNKIAN